jgi:hypothetical protein
VSKYEELARLHYEAVEAALCGHDDRLYRTKGLFEDLAPSAQAAWTTATALVVRVAPAPAGSPQDAEYDDRQWQRRFGMLLALIEQRASPDLVEAARAVANVVPSSGLPDGITPYMEASALTKLSLDLAVAAKLVTPVEVQAEDPVEVPVENEP